MDPITTSAIGGGLKEVTGGNAGPSTSGSNGQFWTDMTNGDFIVGGSKNDLTTIALICCIGVVVWLYLKKK